MRLKKRNEQLESNLAKLYQAYEQLMQHEERQEVDLRQAQHLQQSLLPAGFPQLSGMSLFGYYRPCEWLGGDFFDIVQLDETRLAVYLTDVSGHGVHAAMVTVILRELIHGHYRIIYELAADTVHILAIHHGARLLRDRPTR